MKIEGEEIPEMAESGGSSIRSRERRFEVLSYSELRHDLSLRKSGERGVLYIRGAFGLVPFCTCVARGQGGSTTFEFVLSPFCIRFAVIAAEDNPVFAVFAQLAVYFDLEDWFLNTEGEVRGQGYIRSSR